VKISTHVSSQVVGVKMEAFFHDPHTGQDLVLLLDGDWLGYGGNITVGEGGPVIAQMQREFKGRDFFGGQTVRLHQSIYAMRGRQSLP
jgi:hypothetical protein